jgi:enamine deaminase RidA (YjgF/YER057c/UK114 family)
MNFNFSLQNSLFSVMAKTSSFFKGIFLVFLLNCNFQVFAQKSHQQILDSMGIKLPVVSAPMANYVRFVQTGNLVFTSGHGPTTAEGKLITGRLGADLTIEQGYEAARITGLQLLATLQQALGNLNRVKRIVKVLGMVQCTPDFKDQPKVMNGFSDLMVAVFGEKGRHARSAVGMNALPNGMAVEIEMVVEVE